MKDSPFFNSATLMLEMIPFVAEENCFALKGGTAINFFVRDMPRLSVDIDLTYLPIEDWDVSRKNIGAALKRIAAAVQKASPDFKIQIGLVHGTKDVAKLYISRAGTQIKIEPNPVIRGCVWDPRALDVSPAVEKMFGVSASIAVVSAADLYGGKICAALDRQHPRDLFDIKILFENEGLTDEIRRGFLVALAGHSRPMSELLSPTRKDIQALYQNQFQGMTSELVTLESLLTAREKLIADLKASLTANEKRFLLSLKKGAPDWELMKISGGDALPAIQWKLMNIRKMKPEQHRKSLERLKAVLEL